MFPKLLSALLSPSIICGFTTSKRTIAQFFRRWINLVAENKASRLKLVRLFHLSHFTEPSNPHVCSTDNKDAPDTRASWQSILYFLLWWARLVLLSPSFSWLSLLSEKNPSERMHTHSLAYTLCLKNAPTLASCSFDNHGLGPILIIFGKQHHHTFKNDRHIQLSLSIYIHLFHLLLNSCDGKDAEQRAKQN